MQSKVEDVDLARGPQPVGHLLVEKGESFRRKRTVGARPSVNDGDGLPFQRGVHGFEEAADSANPPAVRENILSLVQAVLPERIEGRQSRAEAARFLAVCGDGDSHLYLPEL